MGNGDNHLPIKAEFGLYSARFGKILFNLAAVFCVLSIMSVLAYFVAPVLILMAFFFTISAVILTLGLILIPFPDLFSRLGEFSENSIDIASKVGSLWLAFATVALVTAVLFLPIAIADRRSRLSVRIFVAVVILLYCIIVLVIGGVLGVSS